MIDGEDFMIFDELQKRCESEIERHLLRALYPKLGPDASHQLKLEVDTLLFDLLVD